jgi:hypothetical protein
MKTACIVTAHIVRVLGVLGLALAALSPITTPLNTCERETGNTGRCYDHIPENLQVFYSNPTRVSGVVVDVGMRSLVPLVLLLMSSKTLKKKDN